MSDFAYGEELAGYEQKLAQLLVQWERVVAIPKAADRIERTDPLLEKIACIQRELYAAQRAWDQALDALLDETNRLRFIGLIMQKIIENPYTALYREAQDLQLEINRVNMTAHTLEAIRAISGDQT